MHQRKSKKVLVYFFLFVLISSINNVSLSSINFNKIQNINVSGLSKDENKLTKYLKSTRLPLTSKLKKQFF